MNKLRFVTDVRGGVAGFGRMLCAVVFMLVLTGCGESETGTSPPATTPAAEKLLLVTADSLPTTEMLTLVFSGAIEGLSVADIEIKPADGSSADVTRRRLMRLGTMSRNVTVTGAPEDPVNPVGSEDPFVYTIGVSVTKSCKVDVSVNKNGTALGLERDPTQA
ncbi:MAG: hypothetical protein LBG27_10165 [Spirochaetaceae bacterium]|jgi:hypothetical protein|nr:hypothetical protein [Spirochaetaceae bacterium]